MARYLLSSRTVLDVIQHKGQPGEVWLAAAASQRGVIARDLCISAVTPMAVRRELEQRIARIKAGTPDPDFLHDDLIQMGRNADTLFRDYGSEDRIVPMTASIATRWGDLLDQKIEYLSPQGEIYAIGSVQKLEIATAIIGRNDISYDYVEREQEVHANLNGLVVTDPTRPLAPRQ